MKYSPEESRIYGTGVNVAARVQPFALPGGICITEDVFRHVEKNISHEMRSIGVQTLKNISRRYELYRVVTGHEGTTQEIAEQDPRSDRQFDSRLAVPATPSGELDEIKDKILSEIGKWSDKNTAKRSRAGDDRGAHAESKVFGLVEHIMDRAIEKWDKMPAEKKSDIVHKIKVGMDEHAEKKDEKSASNIVGEIGWGITATVGFGLWYSQAGSLWMIIVGTLIGVFPLISGVQKLIKRTAQKRKERKIQPATLESEVLMAAKALGGRVTVVQIAAQIGRSLAEVETALDAMTSKGYVSQEILENGVIRYEFPELLPDVNDSAPIG